MYAPFILGIIWNTLEKFPVTLIGLISSVLGTCIGYYLSRRRELSYETRDLEVAIGGMPIVSIATGEQKLYIEFKLIVRNTGSVAAAVWDPSISVYNNLSFWQRLCGAYSRINEEFRCEFTVEDHPSCKNGVIYIEPKNITVLHIRWSTRSYRIQDIINWHKKNRFLESSFGFTTHKGYNNVKDSCLITSYLNKTETKMIPAEAPPPAPGYLSLDKRHTSATVRKIMPAYYRKGG